LIHADIFFFITSILVVFLIVGFALVLILFLVYIIPILKDMRDLSNTVKKEGDKLAGDIDELRTTVKTEGGKVKSVFDYLISLFLRRQRIKKKK
jgi:hypothetical protein